MPVYTPFLHLAKPGGGSSGTIPDETADIDVLNGNFDAIDTWAQGMNGVWQAWTPSIGASGTAPTLGTGATQIGRYVKFGTTVIAQAEVIFGTSGVAAGSGNYAFSFPVPPSPNGGTLPMGEVFAAQSGGNVQGPYALTLSGDHMVGNVTFTGTAVGNSNPFVPAASSRYAWKMIYESAS